MKKSLFVALSCFSAAICSKAEAALIAEYFNDYGDTSTQLSGVGSAGSGWAGAWSGNANPGYNAGVSLDYVAAGFADPDNQSGSDDGVGGFGAGGGDGDVATRDFSSGLTGTVWISSLASTSHPSTGRAVLSLESSASIAAYDLAGRLVTGGVTTSSGSALPNTTHLLLARVVIDGAGGDDSVEFWLNPDLSFGLSGLGAPDLSNLGSESDLFGTSLDSIGVSFRRSGSALDSIRISNDANGFALVTGSTVAIPEPNSSLLLLCALAVLPRKRWTAPKC